MKKTIRSFLLVVASLGIWYGSTSIASANSQYSTKRSNSVRLVWRKSMARHAFTAAKGSRYSKHLGMCYGQNSSLSSVTWYTDAYEKLYQKDRHNYAIYYHVQNYNNKVQGWIWRGYLKPVIKQTVPADTPYIALERNQVQTITKLFTGTIYDPRLTEAVQNFIVANDDGETYNDDWRSSLSEAGITDGAAAKVQLLTNGDGSVTGVKFNDEYNNGKLTLKQFFADVAFTTASYQYGKLSTYTSYRGWHIGVASLDKSDPRNSTIISPLIYVALMPANVAK